MSFDDINKDLAGLRKRRGVIKGSLTRMRNFVNEFDIKDKPLSLLEFRQDELPQLNKKYDEVQSQIDLLSEDLDQENNERDAFERDYFAIRSKIQEIINIDKTSSALLSNSMSSNSSLGGSNRVRLPPITIPEFNGNIQGWESFYDCFRSMIHDDNSITAIQKFYYLRSFVTGPALDLIKSVPMTEANYTVAIQRLKQRYDNKGLVIQSHIRSLLEAPQVENQSSTELQALHSHICTHLAALKALAQPTEHWDAWLITIIINRLDTTTSHCWQLSQQDTSLPKYDDLERFIASRCIAMESSEALSINNGKLKITQNPTITKKFNATSGTKKTLLASRSSNDEKCVYCAEPHRLYMCSKFKELVPNDRANFVREKRLCYNCLSPYHRVDTCKSRFVCQKCQRRHNTIIHVDYQEKAKKNNEEESQANNSPTATEEPTKLALTAQHEGTHVFLATAVVFVTDNVGSKRECRVVLDSGSQINFVSKKLANLLQLPRKNASLPISGIGAKQIRSVSYIDLNVQSRTSSYQVDLACHVLPNMVTDLTSCAEPTTGWRIPPEMSDKLADPKFYQRRSIDLLIGGGTFFDILCSERRIIDKGPLYLQNSQFGWIVTGELGVTCLLGINSVGENLEETWQSATQDKPSKYGRLSKVNQKCLEEEETIAHFRQTTSRDADGRFIVGLPKKPTVKNLGTTLGMATSRFLSIERRLQADENLKIEYTAFMDEYIKLGHMREVIGEANIPQPSFYLPHHAVIKGSSLTTKVRVVFDASAKSSSNLSLNDVLMRGPTVQEDVFAILTRFRKFQYAITADVEKMFRQVHVAKEDWDLQRIVWRSDPKELLRTYQLTTVTYGTTPASFLATQCLVSLAEEATKNFPQASKAILHDFYMDDLMTGADTIEECYKLQQEINVILSSAKLPLRKWCSNSLSILKLIGKREHDPLFSLEIGDQETIKSLGLQWKPLLDQFHFAISASVRKKKLTKRMILSDLNRIFDPLGLLSPVLVKGKIFLQQMWAMKMDWDSQLSEEMQKKWVEFYQALEQLKCCTIPRKAIPVISNEVEMHGFCDASEQAYGACVYVRSRDVNGHWHTRLLCAKTRVAPLKGVVTIPRLELNGALLLAELVHKVAESWMIESSAFRLWTDSMIVLSWLNSHSARLKMFVQNRVCQILELTIINQWRYVRTNNNPADIISRGISSLALTVADEWWQGPQWMSTDEELWSPSTVQLIGNDQMPEQRTLKIALIACDTIITLFNAHSNWKNLIRSVAWILRFIKYKTKKVIDTPKFLTAIDLKGAELAVIKRVQEEAFHEEIIKMNIGKELPRGSKIANLCPFLKHGLIRVGGRLENADIPEHQKHPIVIPANSRITRLIFEDRHRMLCHCGPQSLLAEVRRNYWPMKGRIMARSVTSRCVTCIKAKPVFLNPRMAPLPKDRVQYNRPFAVCGVDFAGPLTIKSGLRRVTGLKAWIAIFVCFATRAIHLEPVEDLSSSAFIACLRRFVSRRGKCSKIYSDNGTNFVGAQRELTNYIKGIDEKMANEGIEWKFNPPAAPHFGGLWESAVKTTKFHLTRMMKETRLTLGELNTLLCQVEACVNSRPITPLNSSPLDLEVLTPAHFLVGGSLFTIPEGDLTKGSSNGLRRWKYVQYLMQTFWKRWEKEYLPQHQVRGKWLTNTKPLEIKDIVIIKGEDTRPTKWKLGRVIELHPGKDKIVRVATVRTANGMELRRPTVKLCRLPIQDEDKVVEK